MSLEFFWEDPSPDVEGKSLTKMLRLEPKKVKDKEQQQKRSGPSGRPELGKARAGQRERWKR